MRAMSRILVAGVAGMAAAAAMADEKSGGGWQWYYSAGIPLTDLQTDGLVEDAAALGVAINDEAGDLAVGGQGTLGVMFTRNLGLELRYAGSGAARDKPTVTNATRPFTLGSTRQSIDGFTLYAVGRWPLRDRVDLMGKIGYTIQDIEFDATLPVNTPDPDGPNVTISYSDDDDGLAGSIGVRIQTGERWAVTAEVEYLAVDFDNRADEPVRGSLNIELMF